MQRFYRYHELMHEKEVEKARKLGGSSGRPPYWTVFKQAFPQLFNVFFIFFITLSLFPNVQSGWFLSIKCYTIKCFLNASNLFLLFFFKQISNGSMEILWYRINCMFQFCASWHSTLVRCWAVWQRLGFNGWDLLSSINEWFQ